MDPFNASFDLTGHKALVTGGTGGLGRAIAAGLHAAGAEVVVSGASGRAQAVAAELGQSGPRVVGLDADLQHSAARQQLFAQSVAALGEITLLVAAHGTIGRYPAAEVPLDDWQRVIEVNLNAVWELCQLAGRPMLARRAGKIILVASLLSFSGGYKVPAYAASKGGVAQIAKALANEWASQGVNVNALAPGYFETALTDVLRRDPLRYPQILERIPAGRWGWPEELAGAAVFLASRAADYIHGVVLPVDGGWMAR
jgi:2-dehydro-3-deoxy-D-gluconate 5-dehydrogenase